MWQERMRRTIKRAERAKRRYCILWRPQTSNLCAAGAACFARFCKRAICRSFYSINYSRYLPETNIVCNSPPRHFSWRHGASLSSEKLQEFNNCIEKLLYRACQELIILIQLIPETETLDVIIEMELCRNEFNKVGTFHLEVRFIGKVLQLLLQKEKILESKGQRTRCRYCIHLFLIGMSFETTLSLWNIIDVLLETENPSPVFSD